MTSPAWRPRWRGRPPSSPALAAGERGLDRLAGAGEDGEDAVAEELAFDGGAGVLADDGAEGGVEVAGLRAEGGVAEALGEGGGVDDVGEEDDGGAGRDGRRRVLGRGSPFAHKRSIMSPARTDIRNVVDDREACTADCAPRAR